MSRQEGPIKPQPKPLRLEKPTTAIAVLDLSVRCDDPQQVCSQLMADLRAFLDRARAAGVPIVFTCSFSAKGTPDGEVAKALNRRPTETVIYPDAFDKFAGGELPTFLQRHSTRHLIIVGSATHVAVMYTASAAARVHKYDVVIPLDGIRAAPAVGDSRRRSRSDSVHNAADDRVRIRNDCHSHRARSGVAGLATCHLRGLAVSPRLPANGWRNRQHQRSRESRGRDPRLPMTRRFGGILFQTRRERLLAMQRRAITASLGFGLDPGRPHTME